MRMTDLWVHTTRGVSATTLSAGVQAAFGRALLAPRGGAVPAPALPRSRCVLSGLGAVWAQPVSPVSPSPSWAQPLLDRAWWTWLLGCLKHLHSGPVQNQPPLLLSTPPPPPRDA